MRVLLLFSLLLVAACAPVATPDPSPVLEIAANTPRNADERAEAAACPAKGGHLARVGKAQALRCIITYADAGKACTDGSQCLGHRCSGDEKDEGSTTPVTGRCVATNDPFGCNVIV